MPLNKSLVGKTYTDIDPWPVTAEGAVAYAKATNLTDPRFVDPARPGLEACPMYGVTFQFFAVTAPLLDASLGVNLLRLVHGEQDMKFLAPVKAGDVIRTVVRIHNIQERPNGELLELNLVSRNQADVPVLDAVWGLFIRGRVRRAEAAKVEEDAARASGDVPGASLFDTRLTVAADQCQRYAEASGDRNPIHVDPDVARAAGHPDVILHGLCTTAFIHHAVADTLCGGDLFRVQRLRMKYAKPVLNGETLRITGAQLPGPGSRVAVEMLNAAGQAVVKDAVAELAG